MAVSLGVCWGQAGTLPGEIHATCDESPLQCLTVAETLDALYGQQARSPMRESQNHAEYSFLAVSEREDYLLPTNYKRLQHEVDQTQVAKGAIAPRIVPALAVVPGMAYPGPAVLGDARALAGFLLQRQVYQEGEPERTGWLVFSGEALRHGKTLRVMIDLGHGLRTLNFTVPNPSE
jgi:hypothetical protein